MIVDCAREPRGIFRFLLSCHLEHSCLYSGPIAPELEMAAPYLLQLECNNPETRRLIELSWGNSWGVFLRSGTSLHKLRRHLREFLIVRDPQGRRMAFRYYDPRVLRTYLPTCVSEELQTFFGPLECFWTEAKNDPDYMLEFRSEGGTLVKNTHSLTPKRGSLSTDAQLSETRVPLDRTVVRERPPEEMIRAQAPRNLPLTIRPVQMAQFEREEQLKFEDWMAGHLKRFFPAQCARMGGKTVRRVIDSEIAKAKAYGITTRREVCKYIDLVFTFGKDFEVTGKLPLAAEILQRRGDGVRKVSNLMDHARKTLKSQVR